MTTPTKALEALREAAQNMVDKFEAESLLLERETVGIKCSDDQYFAATMETSKAIFALRETLCGLQAQEVGEPVAFDFTAHLARQAAFSLKTFGPGPRVEGVTDHIAKELAEVRESGGALSEWVDVVILGLDGAWRSGASPEQIIAAIVAKQTKNEGRNWPDWRSADPGKAIEHDRSSDQRPPTAPSLSDEQIFEIADSEECNPDDRGWGPKFSTLLFARAVIRAALQATEGK